MPYTMNISEKNKIFNIFLFLIASTMILENHVLGLLDLSCLIYAL
jgi:hypothetical protein